MKQPKITRNTIQIPFEFIDSDAYRQLKPNDIALLLACLRQPKHISSPSESSKLTGIKPVTKVKKSMAKLRKVKMI